MRQLQGMKPLIPTVYQFTFGIATLKDSRSTKMVPTLPVLTVLSLVVGSHGHSRCRAHFSPGA